MAYVLHFDLESFIEQAEHTALGGEPIYVQVLVRTHTIGGVAASLTVQLIATYKDHSGTIHAARIVVERVEIITEEAERRRVVAERIDQARALLIEALPVSGAVVHGILTEPGLLTELDTIETRQHLWRWDGNRRNPLERRLVPMEDLDRPLTFPAA